MASFIKKILKIILLQILALICIYMLFDARKKFDPVSKDITTLFVGDSHIQKAIDDSVIKGSKNIAVIAENYYFSYNKLLYCLSHKNNVKRVVLGFGCHNLSTIFDTYLNGKENSEDYSPIYFNYLPFKEKMYLMSIHLNKNMINYISSVFRNIVSPYDIADKTNFWGGYENDFYATSYNKGYTDERIGVVYYRNGILRNFSDSQLSYLDKIIELCKKNGIEIMLMNTPSHPYYYDHIPQVYKDEYEKLKRKYNVPVLEFSRISLPDSCFLPDGDHVSRKGAKIISELVEAAQTPH